MNVLNTRSGYGTVSWTLHWIIVLALLTQWLLSETDEHTLPIPGVRIDALTLHQSIGLTVLLLALVRLAWRSFNPKPAWPADMKSYEITLARTVHIAFYLMLFAIPLTGWALSSVEDEPLRFFNWFAVPRVALASEGTLEETHEILFNILVGLAVLHVFGASKHWIVSRRVRSGPRTAS